LWVLSALGVGTPRGKAGVGERKRSHVYALIEHSFILHFV